MTRAFGFKIFVQSPSMLMVMVLWCVWVGVVGVWEWRTVGDLFDLLVVEVEGVVQPSQQL